MNTSPNQLKIQAAKSRSSATCFLGLTVLFSAFVYNPVIAQIVNAGNSPYAITGSDTNIDIQPGGSATLSSFVSAPITVNGGSLSVTSGDTSGGITVNSGSASITSVNNQTSITVSGGTLDSSSPIQTFALTSGVANINGGSIILGVFTLSSGATLNANGGTVNINVLNLSGGTLGVNGAASVNVINATSGTISGSSVFSPNQFTGSGGNVTINNSVTPGSFVNTSTFTTTGSGSLALTGYSLGTGQTINSGINITDLGSMSGGTLNATANISIPSLTTPTGTLTGSDMSGSSISLGTGTFNVNSSVNLSGALSTSSNATLSGTGTITTGSLTASNDLTTFIAIDASAGSVTVGSTLTLNSTTIDAGGMSLNGMLAGAGDLTITGALAAIDANISSTINLNAGSMSVAGNVTVESAITLTGSLSSASNNANLSGGGSVTVDGIDIGIGNSLTTDFSFSNAGSISVNGTFTMGGTITGSGLSIGASGNLTGGGNITIPAASASIAVGGQMWSINPTSTIYSPDCETYGPCCSSCRNWPTPVELIHFSVEMKEEAIHLTWSTASELNNDYFEILKSGNGIDFLPIGQVDGNGTRNFVTDYSYIDKKPLTGSNYYQLLQVDYDGSQNYHTIILIEFDNNRTATVYPTRIKNGATLHHSYKGISELAIYSLQGKKLKTIKRSSGSFSIQGLTAGLYILKDQLGNSFRIHIEE